MNAHTRALHVDIWPHTLRRTQRIHDRVLQLQGAEVGVGDRRMASGEVAGERGARAKMRRPVDRTRRGVKIVRALCLELRQLDKHTIGDA